MLNRIRPALAAMLVAIAAGIIAFASSQPVAAESRAMMLATDPDRLVVRTAKGERAFTIEVAGTPEQRGRGLMYREAMADDHGMLFVFEDERQVGFWMKNTPMPLDLLFIATDGTLKAVLPGEPFSEAVISPGVPVRFVLELKAGTAASAGIAPGDKVGHAAISRAAAQ
jgi:uncharacterized membrane protein (UPF0127 family)